MNHPPRRRRGAFWNALAGGLFLIGLGLIFYFVSYMGLSWENVWPLILVLIGILVIGGAVSTYSGGPTTGEKEL